MVPLTDNDLLDIQIRVGSGSGPVELTREEFDYFIYNVDGYRGNDTERNHATCGLKMAKERESFREEIADKDATIEKLQKEIADLSSRM